MLRIVTQVVSTFAVVVKYFKTQLRNFVVLNKSILKHKHNTLNQNSNWASKDQNATLRAVGRAVTKTLHNRQYIAVVVIRNA